jgi:hypothetical protein
MKQINDEERREMIAKAAYFRAERRGFCGGDPVTDWLEAETGVDAELARHNALDALDARLALANERLQALKKRFAGMKSEVRDELADDLAKLQELRDSFHSKVEVIRTQGEHVSEKARQQAEKAKQQAEKAWDRISRALERLGAPKSEHVE